MLLLFAVAADAPLQFHVDGTEFANAVYHTVCTTGRMSCSRDIYMRFWNEKYKATPEDVRRIHRGDGRTGERGAGLATAAVSAERFRVRAGIRNPAARSGGDVRGEIASGFSEAGAQA